MVVLRIQAKLPSYLFETRPGTFYLQNSRENTTAGLKQIIVLLLLPTFLCWRIILGFQRIHTTSYAGHARVFCGSAK